MTKEEFKILVEEYGVPIEAAERFTPTVDESDGVNWKEKYEALKSEYDDAKNRYLDRYFGTGTEKTVEKEEKEEIYIEEEERDF